MVKKVFFKTFFVTLAVMLACYRGLWLSITRQTRDADTPQTGVPVNHPAPGDSRTVFIAVGDDSRRFFFLVKLNAFQNTVSLVSISPSYIYPTKGRSLSDSMDMAGVMQCVLDTKEEFGINIDHYISCSWDGARKLLDEFTEFGIEELGANLPPVIRTLLLKSRENLDADSMINAVERAGVFLDNEIGLGFLNEGVYLLLKYNTETLYPYIEKRLKANYDSIDTNINTANLKDYEKIINFLKPTLTEYPRAIVIAGEPKAAEKIKTAVGE